MRNSNTIVTGGEDGHIAVVDYLNSNSPTFIDNLST